MPKKPSVCLISAKSPLNQNQHQQLSNNLRLKFIFLRAKLAEHVNLSVEAGVALEAFLPAERITSESTKMHNSTRESTWRPLSEKPNESLKRAWSGGRGLWRARRQASRAPSDARRSSRRRLMPASPAHARCPAPPASRNVSSSPCTRARNKRAASRAYEYRIKIKVVGEKIHFPN